MATSSAVQDRPESILLRLVTALVTAIALAGCGEETPQTETAQRGPGVEAGHGGSESRVAGLEPAGGGLGQGGSLEGRPGGNAEAGATMEPPSPHLLEANPADGSTDIYPFPLPDGLSISLTFSEAMWVVQVSEATEHALLQVAEPARPEATAPEPMLRKRAVGEQALWARAVQQEAARAMHAKPACGSC